MTGEYICHMLFILMNHSAVIIVNPFLSAFSLISVEMCKLDGNLAVVICITAVYIMWCIATPFWLFKWLLTSTSLNSIHQLHSGCSYPRVKGQTQVNMLAALLSQNPICLGEINESFAIKIPIHDLNVSILSIPCMFYFIISWVLYRCVEWLCTLLCFCCI